MAIFAYWWDGFHYRQALVGGGLLVLALLANALSSRGKERKAVRTIGQKQLAVACVTGIPFGLVFAAAVAFTSPLIDFVPTPTRWLDRDRAAVEDKISTLVGAGNYAAAAQEANERLARPLSPSWRAALHERHVQLLIAAGDAAQSNDERVRYWTEAISHADRYGVDERLARTLLESYEQSIRAQELAEQNKLIVEENPLTDEVTRLRSERESFRSRWTAEVLKHSVNTARMSLTPDLPAVRSQLSKQIANAEMETVDTTMARDVLQRLEARIAESTPQSLPIGARAKFLVVRRFSAVSIVELEVTDAAERPISELRSSDFRVAQDQGVLPCVSCRQVTYENESFQLSVLFDVSKSTEGDAILSAKSGLTKVLRGLPRDSSVWLASFADSVHVLTDWTSDQEHVIRQFAGLTPYGRTAMLQAIQVAISRASSRAGPRHVLMFTDGGNNVAGPDLEALVAEAIRANIRIFVVALATPELNLAVLERLTTATGGELVVAAHANQLVDRFQQLSTRLHRTAYQLAVLEYDPGSPCTIQVGGDSSCIVNIPPQNVSNLAQQ